jgi:hypothetical protein
MDGVAVMIGLMFVASSIREAYKAIMNAEVGDLGYEHTVIKELAEALELVHDHLEPSCEDFEGNATGPLIEVEGALTKHADRIEKAKEQG